jgi:hypothetical protein
MLKCAHDLMAPNATIKEACDRICKGYMKRDDMQYAHIIAIIYQRLAGKDCTLETETSQYALIHPLPPPTSIRRLGSC